MDVPQYQILDISIHALLAESDKAVKISCAWSASISIHALLAESDILAVQLGCRSFLFLSTLSLRRATASDSLSDTSEVISIHALLAESDRNADCNCHSAHPISIHALLAESD